MNFKYIVLVILLPIVTVTAARAQYLGPIGSFRPAMQAPRTTGITPSGFSTGVRPGVTLGVAPAAATGINVRNPRPSPFTSQAPVPYAAQFNSRLSDVLMPPRTVSGRTAVERAIERRVQAGFRF